MPAVFETKIVAIATSTVDSLTDVIKRVDFTVRGTKQDHVYEITESTDLANPDPGSFKTLTSVNEADVIAWVNANYTNMQATKDHVEFMLDTQISKGQLTPTPLPWVTQ